MKKLIIILSLLCLPVFAGNYDLHIQNRTISYNPDELKFYENSKLLSKEEVAELFPDYEIVLISQFDKNKKYKIKNSPFKFKKILVLNDTRRTFQNFYVYPENSRYEENNKKIKEVKSLITVWGKKNVRIKHFGGDEFEIVVR